MATTTTERHNDIPAIALIPGDVIIAARYDSHATTFDVERTTPQYLPGTVAVSTNGNGSVYTRQTDGRWLTQSGSDRAHIRDSDIPLRTVKIIFDPATDFPVED